MRNRATRQTFPGATLAIVEWGVAGCLLVIALTFALISLWGNWGESRDAHLVQTVHEALQSIVSEGALRMDTRPDALPPRAVIIAIQSALAQKKAPAGQSDDPATPSVHFTTHGGRYLMTIDHSGRSAVFTVDPNGDVRLVGLNRFPNYRVDTVQGSITRSP